MNVIIVNPFEAVWATQRITEAFDRHGAAEFLRTKMVPELQARARLRFDHEGDTAAGGRWAPLAESTQAMRISQGYQPDHPINVRTGDLRRWVITNEGRVGGTREGARLTWPGSTAEGGRVLTNKYSTAQKGIKSTRFGRVKTIARPVVALGVVDEMIARQALREWAYDRAGLRGL